VTKAVMKADKVRQKTVEALRREIMSGAAAICLKAAGSVSANQRHESTAAIFLLMSSSRPSAVRHLSPPTCSKIDAIGIAG
jgi:hypothetical protein